MTDTAVIQQPPDGPLRLRAARQLGVSFPKRLIELVVMPYDEETLAPVNGRMVRESAAPGCFHGIERRANRIRVNRDHDVRRTVGRALAFHPSRAEGLVAELRIAQTELGDETLQLADDDCLDASAAFLPMPGGEKWLARSRVRYTKLWLGHIAMTPDPSYIGARVLSVRHAEPPPTTAEPVATPNLDTVRAWLLDDRYSRVSKR